MRQAISYIRFSSGVQAAGDSYRRQVARTEEFCKKHALALDDSLRVEDLGVSGHQGKNAKVGQLATFLALVRSGRVRQGTVLVIENLDRLSRDEFWAASDIIREVISGGVTVATVEPERFYDRDAISQPYVIMELMVTLQRAHEYSKRLSDLLTQSWQRRRDLIPQGRKISGIVPSWLDLDPETKVFTVDAGRAAVVERIFRLATEGLGVPNICKTLVQEGVPPIARRGRQPGAGKPAKGLQKPAGVIWARSYVRTILTERTVLGEYQPCRWVNGRSVPTGDPVPGYYPAVIEEATYYKAQAAIRARARVKGRNTDTKEVVNLFQGVLRDYDSGETYQLRQRESKHGKYHQLYTASSFRGQRTSPGFRLDKLEAGFLRFVSELKAEDFVDRPTEGTDAVAEVSGKLSALDVKLQRIEQRIRKEDDIEALLDLFTSLKADKARLQDELERLRTEATTHTSQSVGELRSLSAMLGEAQGEERTQLRQRIKGTIRQLCEAIYLRVEDCQDRNGKPARVGTVLIALRAGYTRIFQVAYLRTCGVMDMPEYTSVLDQSPADLALLHQHRVRRSKDA
jgi:DNA invertase Pin-like site-specific DNA recombinase